MYASRETEGLSDTNPQTGYMWTCEDPRPMKRIGGPA